jgi:Tfp pilus assembly protein PilX
MKQKHLTDQRGIAMVVELLLVAVVLTVVGMAIYQTTKHDAAKTADSNSPAAVAASAAAIGESEQAADDGLSASASAASDQIMDSDTDVSNLGGSTGANSF